MILALAARLGCLAHAIADRLKPRDDAAFDAHVADALAVLAEPPPPEVVAKVVAVLQEHVLADWAAEVEALADIELQDLIREDRNR